MSMYTIKKYLDASKAPYTRSDETVYQFYGRMPEGSRISGCEVFLRSAGADIFVTIELPVNVMPRESHGVAKYLARINQERSEEGKQGYFMLDYVKHKIIYALPGSDTMDAELLESAIEYAVRQVDFEIEEIIRVVCEEGDRIFKEDEERRRQREREEREPSPFTLLTRKLKNTLLLKLGMIEEDDLSDLPEYYDPDDDSDEFSGYEPVPFTPEKGEEQPETEEESDSEKENDPEEESAPNREPEFEEILKILGIDKDEKQPETADEPAEEQSTEEAPAQEAAEPAAAEESPKEEEQQPTEEK